MKNLDKKPGFLVVCVLVEHVTSVAGVVHVEANPAWDREFSVALLLVTEQLVHCLLTGVLTPFTISSCINTNND